MYQFQFQNFYKKQTGTLETSKNTVLQLSFFVKWDPQNWYRKVAWWENMTDSGSPIKFRSLSRIRIPSQNVTSSSAITVLAAVASFCRSVSLCWWWQNGRTVLARRGEGEPRVNARCCSLVPLCPRPSAVLDVHQRISTQKT